MKWGQKQQKSIKHFILTLSYHFWGCNHFFCEISSRKLFKYFLPRIDKWKKLQNLTFFEKHFLKNIFFNLLIITLVIYNSQKPTIPQIKAKTFHLVLILLVFWLESISFEIGSCKVVSFFLTQTLHTVNSIPKYKRGQPFGMD